MKLGELLKCGVEGGKKCYLSKLSADEFASQINKKHGGSQHSYLCPTGDHWHLTSKPLEGAPVLAQKPWPAPPPPKPETITDRIVAVLRKHNGTKTTREIATECGVSFAMSSYAAKAYGLPVKAEKPYLAGKKYGKKPQLSEVSAIQTERERLLAALRALEIKEEQLKKEEAERRSVKLQVSSTMNAKQVLLTVNKKHIQLSFEQSQDLLSKLPDFLKENFEHAMKAAS